ncbi:MAG: hydrogenase formation protein HypD [Coriobacteriia bacterium]|nr:hydrogenase formation protein HypD [Coriobacteriia bacterium]
MNMNLLNKFKDPELLRGLLERMLLLAHKIQERRGEQPLCLMEVCGTHTVAIAKCGLKSVLPPAIKLISGPGCPVCVTAHVDIDRIIAATRVPQATIMTFGDMMRVPGSSTSLEARRAEGARIEVVYSPLDALSRALKHPKQQIIFVAVGFETTTPLIAATLKRAKAAGAENFSILTVHKRVTPALSALASDPSLAIDGLILPGHVSTIIGTKPYGVLAEQFGMPSVIAGFDPVDLLLALVQLLEGIEGSRTELVNAYGRAVHEQGNAEACALIDEVFEVSDAVWRGLGVICESGHVLNQAYDSFDAGKRFDLPSLTEPTKEPKGCSCGDILRGIMTPNDCLLFGTACTPTHPIGPCMVSSEGSCAAYYKYQIGERA